MRSSGDPARGARERPRMLTAGRRAGLPHLLHRPGLLLGHPREEHLLDDEFSLGIHLAARRGDHSRNEPLGLDRAADERDAPRFFLEYDRVVVADVAVRLGGPRAEPPVLEVLVQDARLQLHIFEERSRDVALLADGAREVDDALLLCVRLPAGRVRGRLERRALRHQAGEVHLRILPGVLSRRGQHEAPIRRRRQRHALELRRAAVGGPVRAAAEQLARVALGCSRCALRVHRPIRPPAADRIASPPLPRRRQIAQGARRHSPSPPHTHTPIPGAAARLHPAAPAVRALPRPPPLRALFASRCRLRNFAAAPRARPAPLGLDGHTRAREVACLGLGFVPKRVARVQCAVMVRRASPRLERRTGPKPGARPAARERGSSAPVVHATRHAATRVKP